MVHYFKLMRPAQWMKNLFVFAPLFFSRNLTNTDLLLFTCMAFAVFCMASSAVYCLNDILDLESDKAHPLKRHRPLASGMVSVRGALWTTVLCVTVAVIITIVLDNLASSIWPLLIILFYWLLNIGYCVKMKNYAIIDVGFIGMGFVLRVLAGGAVTHIWISQWLLLLTFLLAVFLALSKRTSEFHLDEKRLLESKRKSIDGYNVLFLYTAIAVVASVIMVCYIQYTISLEVMIRMGSPYLYATTIFVLGGLLRYMQLMMVYHHVEGPTRALVKDLFLQVCIVGWGLCYTIIIYLL
ncbi:MAG: UbiA prenyltransferase family protein [Prevotella sp.]|nr:UbiA prenyltransferase family protein [Prevotella sp.]